LLSIKQACAELGLTERRHIEAIFHDNAVRLIKGIMAKKNGLENQGKMAT